MDFVVTVHSVIRWAVFAVLLVGLGQAFREGTAPRPLRIVASIFVGLLDLQLLLGVILLFQKGVLATTWRHVAFMVVAVALAHILSVRARKAAATATARRDHILLYAVPLTLILFGLLQVV